MAKSAAIADVFCMLPGISACRKLIVSDTRKMLERHATQGQECRFSVVYNMATPKQIPVPLPSIHTEDQYENIRL